MLVTTQHSLSILPAGNVDTVRPVSGPSIETGPVDEAPAGARRVVFEDSCSVVVGPPRWRLFLTLIFRGNVCRYRIDLSLDRRAWSLDAFRWSGM